MAQIINYSRMASENGEITILSNIYEMDNHQNYLNTCPFGNHTYLHAKNTRLDMHS